MPTSIILEYQLDKLPWKKLESILDACYERPPRDVFQKVVAASHQSQRVWLAMDKSYPIGMVMLSPHSKGGHLDNLAVIPKAQGRGIGKQLVVELLHSVEMRGPAMVTLTTRIPEYFKPFGFKNCGKLIDGSTAMSTVLPTQNSPALKTS